ncbi:MAG: hypothetical protein ACJAS9_001930 [Polaribacter sp.]|jgi:hypothetical protein
MYKSLIILLVLIPLSACSINPEVYKEKSPSFVFEEFFTGNMCAWGTVKDRNNQVTRKFIADIKAYKENSMIVLDERFSFDDGEKQTRVWKFETQNNQISGVAGDVVGSATGVVYGDSLNLSYRLLIQMEDDSIEIEMDDWLHLIDENTLMGTTKMSKWGFNVGEINILMRKHQNDQNWCIKVNNNG